MLRVLLIVIVFLIAGFAIYAFLKRRSKQEAESDIEVDDKTYTLELMTAFVKRRLDEITKINLYDIGLSEEELKRRKQKKYELKKALKGCTYGDVNDKRYVKELISDLLSKEYGVDETNISKAIPFDVPSLLTAQDKFDIIIYMYKKEFGYEALTELIKRYNLATLKYLQGESKPSYVITEDEISDIYEKEKLVLSFKDKLEIVVQRIYQHYKGYSSIDEIRDMNIDGVSGGVSGLPESFISQVAQTGTTDYIEQVSEHKVPRACDSIWIFFQGKSIRLAFLSFGTEAERYLVNFLKLLCERGILGEYSGCCEEFTRRYNVDHNIATAVVTSAVALTDEQMAALKDKLEKISGKTVTLTQKTDPTVLAGLKVELEGRQLDGTVKSRLDDLSRKLNELIV